MVARQPQPVNRRAILARRGGAVAAVGAGLVAAACGSTTGATVSAKGGAALSSLAAAAGSSSVLPRQAESAPASGAATNPATSASAGSSATAGVTNPSVNAAGKATVTLHYHTSLNQRQQQLFGPMVAQPFTQRNPNLTIEVVQSQGGFYDKLTTMVAGGTPPDVVWEAYPEAYLGKLITDVTSFVSRDKLDLSVYPKFAMDYDGTWQGKILGLPNQTGGNWPVMPYRHDVFSKASLADPPDHWGDQGWAFIRFQSDTPGWAISRGNLPARQDHLAAWEQALWGGDVGAKARVNVYEASLSHAAKKDPIGHVSNWRGMYAAIISPRLTRVWAGQATIADVLRTVKPRLQSQMKKPV